VCSSDLGRKQTSFHFKAETIMEFNPSGENQETGLTTFLNDKHHYDFFVAMRNGSRCLFVRKTVGDIVCEVTKVKLEAGSVILRIIADAEKYQFQFSTGQAKEYTTVATGLTQYLGTELASTWTGVVIAMYATGNGKKSAQPADFGWFDFQKPVGLN
jgi:xylan 1,4-beta-xylosidase